MTVAAIVKAVNSNVSQKGRESAQPLRRRCTTAISDAMPRTTQSTIAVRWWVMIRPRQSSTAKASQPTRSRALQSSCSTWASATSTQISRGRPSVS